MLFTGLEVLLRRFTLITFFRIFRSGLVWWHSCPKLATNIAKRCTDPNRNGHFFVRIMIELQLFCVQLLNNCLGKFNRLVSNFLSIQKAYGNVQFQFFLLILETCSSKFRFSSRDAVLKTIHHQGNNVCRGFQSLYIP